MRRNFLQRERYLPWRRLGQERSVCITKNCNYIFVTGHKNIIVPSTAWNGSHVKRENNYCGRSPCRVECLYSATLLGPQIMDEQKRRAGRPAGSGEQLPPTERSRQSRQSRAAAGATRLDFFLDPPQAGQLAELMEQWDMATRKEVVQHALDIVHQTVAKNRKAPA